MANNKNLQEARVKANDEFYTKYETVAAEIPYYRQFLEGKIIYCNCDDPEKSNIWCYLRDHFGELHLKKLISTYFTPGDHSKKTVVTMDKSGKLRTRRTALEGDGDFASKECVNILKSCDVVISNPPWSLAAKYLDLVYTHGKKFIVLANQNVFTSRLIYPHIMKRDIYIGVSIRSGDTEFAVPESYPLSGTKCRIDENGTRFISVTSTRWITNLDHGVYPAPIKLHTRKWNLKHNLKLIRKLAEQYSLTKYGKYDNADAIEVPFSDSIPSDVKGAVGVPISFLDKFNPDQFQIVGARKGDDGKDLKINGVAPYFRILVRRREVSLCRS